MDFWQGIGQLAAREVFPTAPDDSAVLIRAVGARTAACVVGAIGVGLVALFTRARREPATPFDTPLRR